MTFKLKSTNGNGHKRVLHLGKFYPPHKGGMETHLQDLCERLQGKIETEVVVAGETSKTSSETVNGVQVTRMGTLFDFKAAPVCPDLMRLVRKSTADIVHLHVPNPTGVVANLVDSIKRPLVVTYHSDVIRQKILGSAFQPILDRCLRRAAAIICTSPNYIESSPVLNRFREQCRVIPLGVATAKFQKVDEAAVRKIHEEFGNRIVLGVGRLIYYKGFEHLIQAMKKVDARLLLIGDGPLRQSLEEQARSIGVADRVTFLGEIDNVAPYLQAASVFVLSSVARSEAFGIVQLEAMACGTPVVNTSLRSGVPYVSVDGVTGITVPPSDSEALASAINQLLSDGALRERFGAAGRRRVEAEFSADLMAERTLNLYKEILN